MKAMKRRKPGRQQQYSIVIASETDIRKKPAVFNLKLKTIMIASAGTFLLFIVSAVLTVISVIQSSRYSVKAEALKTQVDTQYSILDAYSGEIEALEEEVGKAKTQTGR